MSDSQNTQLAVSTGGGMMLATSSIFEDFTKLAAYEQLALKLSTSKFIPKSFQEKPDEILIALEYAANMGMRPLMVMQNLVVVEGKPSWEGKFVGSVIRSCGRFVNMRYVMGEAGVVPVAYAQGAYEPSPRKIDNLPNLTCYVLVNDARTGDEIKGTTVSVAMAVAEGWYGKKGSKWPTLTEQMLQYRSASFFGRLHVQDILFGMHSADEVADMQGEYRDAGTEASVVAGNEFTAAIEGPRPRRARKAAPTLDITPESAGTSWPVTQAERTAADERAESDRAEYEADKSAGKYEAPAATAAPVEPAPAMEITREPASVAAPQSEPVAEPAKAAPAAKKPAKAGKVTELAPEVQTIIDGGVKGAGEVLSKLVLPAGFALLTIDGEVETPDNADANESAPNRLARINEQLLWYYSKGPGRPVAAAPEAESAAMRNQRIRDEKQTQQYADVPPKATPAMFGPDSAGKFYAEGSEAAGLAWPLTGNPATERAAEQTAAAQSIETPEADKVPDPFAGMF